MVVVDGNLAGLSRSGTQVRRDGKPEDKPAGSTASVPFDSDPQPATATPRRLAAGLTTWHSRISSLGPSSYRCSAEMPPRPSPRVLSADVRCSPPTAGLPSSPLRLSNINLCMYVCTCTSSFAM